MLESNEAKRTIKKKKYSKKRIVQGFQNGKLYRGKSNKKTERNLNNKAVKKDYKKSNNSKKQSINNPKVNHNFPIKKTLLSIILILVPILVTVIIINLMSSAIAQEDNEVLQDNSEDIRRDILLKNNLSDIDNNTNNYDNIVVNSEEDNDNFPEISLNTNFEDFEETNLSEEELETSFSNNTSSNTYSENNNEEAIFFLSINESDYGLVGFPLNEDIKRLTLKDKIYFLAKELLKNPTNRNAITMMPSGTKFLGYNLIGTSLYLNFNEQFNYNIYGVEGDIQQIAQIIYTFTSLKGIDKVAFLINGKFPESIGSHGLQNKEWSEEDIGSLL